MSFEGTDQTLERTSILLPGDDFVVDRWVAQFGSVVRMGETIAYACHKRDATIGASNPDLAPLSTAPVHKRPNRRRPLQTGGVVAAKKADTSSSNGTAAAATKSYPDTSFDLKERLAARLASKTTGQQAKEEQLSVPTTIAVKNMNSGTTISISKKDTIPVLAPASGLLRRQSNNSLEKSERLCIGYVENCLHPTFLDGICVVCGNSVPRNTSVGDAAPSRENSHAGALSRVTVSGGVTLAVSEHESRQMAEMDSERLFRQKRLSLVLDLDHTLVHATSDARASQYLSKHNDVRSIRLPMFEGADARTRVDPRQANMWANHYVKLRPHVQEFLRGVQSLYEVTVYTAGTRQYAEEITMLLCRNLVGSNRDCYEIEQLRGKVELAKEEYSRLSQLNGEEKKRKIEQTDQGNDALGDIMEPPKKRKKISFGFHDSNSDQTAPKSDHITRQTLDAMQIELRDADDLEQQARELRQTIFGSRVFSRTDVGDLGRDVKSLKRIFPCGGTMAAVVDDREDVWANANDNSQNTIKGEPPDNLLLVRPYHWQPFVGFADINNAAGDDLSGPISTSKSRTDKEDDVQLLWTKQICEELHKIYYQQSEEGNRQTVPDTLKNMRRRILEGCCLVLSGLVPLRQQNAVDNAVRPPMVRYAQALGAKVSAVWCFM